MNSQNKALTPAELEAVIRPIILRELPEKELRRRYHDLRRQYADVKRELERRKSAKAQQREQQTRMRAPG